MFAAPSNGLTMHLANPWPHGRKAKARRLRHSAAKVLSSAIVYLSLFLMGILALLACVLLLPMFCIWTLADHLTSSLEASQSNTHPANDNSA